MTIVESPKRQLHTHSRAVEIRTDLLGLLATWPYKRASNDYLGPIFFWQEVLRVAEDRLKHCWAKAQNAQVVASDDNLRKTEFGEHIVAESRLFRCLIRLSRPRKVFDKDLFISMVADRYKIKVRSLVALAEQCEHDSAPSLSKKVIEV